MTIKFANRVKVSTSTTGTGTITLGSAVDGFQTFSQGGILNGESIRYTIINGDEWEVGTGVYTHSGTVMSRSYEESSTGSLLNLAGDSAVFITVASTDIENIEDTANNALPKAGGTMTGAITFAAGQSFDGRDVSADGSKLDGIESGATGDQTNAEIRAAVEAATDSNVFTDADHSKLNGIEAGATGDQTNAEIRAAVEAATDSNVFTDADHTKLNGIEASADVTDATNVTAAGALMDSEVTNLAQVKAFDSSDYATAAQGTTADAALARSGGTMAGAITFAAGQAFDGRDVSADGDKLDGIETGATADQTDAQIKTAYENNSDTNAFTDAEKTKLSGIETSADVTDTANVTAAGALMDSELTNVAAVKAINQGLTTTSDVTFNDVIVSGDFTVSGTTTTVNTETVNIADNQILLNSNFTGATPTENGGIEIERGSLLANKTLIWDETNDRWTVGSAPFVAGSFVGDGSSVTNVAAASVNVTESNDDNAFYNVLFSDTDGSGSVQMTPTQDDGGLTFNPSTNTLFVNNVTTGTAKVNNITHNATTSTYINFTSLGSNQSISFVAGGVGFLDLIEGDDDYIWAGQRLYMASGTDIVFEGSTADDFETILDVTDPTADRTITFPDATGTVALDDVATTSADGLMSSTDKTKLDGIEAGADVTDATNVTAAGALMDSEVTNLAQVKAFDSSDYATAAQGTTADAALPKAGGTMTGDLIISDTTADSAAGPELTLYRDSASPADGDYLGQLRFEGKRDTGVDQLYAKLTGKTSDVTAGTEDGLLETAVVKAGVQTIVSRQTGSALKLINDTGLEVAGSIVVDGTVDGRDVASDGSKLDGIETSADVTDTANVTSSGALMDSEVTNLAQVKAFDSSDYATAAQGTTADNALPKSGGAMTGAITFDASQTFDAADLTGTLPSIDGSNLTNVAASTVNVAESSDDNAFYNVLFSDTTGTGGVQMAPTQDDSGLTFNPQSNVLYANNFQMADKIQHDGDTDTNISFTNDSITFTAGGVDFIQLIEGTTDYVSVSTDLFLDTNARLSFEGSTSDGFETFLTVTDPTADRTITLPNATGTVALTSDLYTNSDVDTHLNRSSAGTNQILSWSGSDYAWVNDSDTTYSNATTSAAGLMSSSDKTKLDNIEASADVTDATNVTAAGALMDSEVTNLAQVKAFDSSDYATAAQGTTANNALPKAGGTMTGAITFDASQTFDASDLTGTLPAIDGSNLTNVTAASVEVTESADDNVTYNILFSDTDGTGNVQMTPTQDDNGLTYNPALDTLTTFKIQVADSIVHRDDTNTYIDFGLDEIKLVAGGVEFIRLVEGTEDYVRFGKRIYLTTDQNIQFEGSTSNDFETTLYVVDPTAARTILLPDASGTIALDDVATTSADGLMSSSDKTKLDGIEASADVTDTTNVTAAGALMDSEVTNVAQVKAFDSSDYATAAQGTTADNALPKAGGALTGAVTTNSTFDGRDVATDGTKLDGIEASADVTDTTNVTAAGALMDSEVTNLAQVKAFDSSDYATAAQGTTADNALPKAGGTMTGNLTVDSGTSTTLLVKCDDGGNAIVRAGGDNQGTGVFEVTQDGGNHGGGISYNGDGSPSFVGGETADNVTFYRIESGTRTEVFHYPYNGNTVNFNGSITLGGTVDGRDVATDGTKLDGIESGATADQTASEILTAIKTVDGSGSGLDADTVDGIQASSFLRSDANDSTSSTITFSNDIVVGDQIIHDGDTDTYMQFDAADSWRVVAGGGEKLSTATNGITITSTTGNATFGSSNSTWFHMSTDRPNFYMAQGLRVDGTLGVYNQNTYLTSDDIYLNGVLYHYGDTDTYMQFHNSNEWRIVTGGDERLEVTNSAITSAEPILAPYFEATSDINLKENIVKVESAVSKIQKLNGYTYNFKDEPEISKAGLIAQEVQEVLPEAVRVDKDNNLRLDYNGTIALLVEAIKDQQKQIDQLTARLS